MAQVLRNHRRFILTYEPIAGPSTECSAPSWRQLVFWSWSKEGTVRHCCASSSYDMNFLSVIIFSLSVSTFVVNKVEYKARKLAYYGNTIRKQRSCLQGERDNVRNNVRCRQARKTMYGLDGQHQDVDRTFRGRVNPWCGQASD